MEKLFATIQWINTELAAQRAAGIAQMDVKIKGDQRGQSGECGPTTRLRIFATPRAALNAAVRQRKITWNPCDGVELEQPDTARTAAMDPRRGGAVRRRHRLRRDGPDVPCRRPAGTPPG